MTKWIFFVCGIQCAFSGIAQEATLLKHTFQGLYQVTASTDLRKALGLTTGNEQQIKPRGAFGECGPTLLLSNWKRGFGLRYEPLQGGSLECFGKEGLIVEKFPVLASDAFTVNFKLRFDNVVFPYQGRTMMHTIFSFSDRSKKSTMDLTNFSVSMGTAQIIYSVDSQCLRGPIIPFQKWVSICITYRPDKVMLSVDGNPCGELQGVDGRSKSGGFVFGCGSLEDHELRFAYYHYYMKDFCIEKLK